VVGESSGVTRVRRLVLVLFLALVGGLVVAVPGGGAAGAAPAGSSAPGVDPAAPHRRCGTGSWVAGTVDLCGGDLIYRDYVYDSFGAASLPRPPAWACMGSAPTDPELLVGDDGYGMLPPAGEQRTDPGNIADLVRLRVRVAGGSLRVRALLDTMVDPAAAKVVVVVDTDGDTEGPSRPLPEVSGVQGIDWDEALVLAAGEPGVVVDPERNVLRGRMPLPAGSTWRLQAVTATADGTVMNVAFRGTDECGFWWENRQAHALAGGDVSMFSHRVEVADLVGGVTRPAPTPRGQVLQRVYVSRYAIGEGVSVEGVPGPAYTDSDPVSANVSQAFNLLGRFQPYGFYLPDQAGPHGVQLLLHGLTENHSARFYLGGASGGRITEHIGEARNRVLASPAGRGWKGWYSSYSERDVLDVLADVQRTYATDADEVIASGYSMGGYGAMRIAALHPDRFAGVVNWVGFTGDFVNGTPFVGFGSEVGALGNALDLIHNLLHVPSAHLYAAQDELVLVPGAIELKQRLRDLRLPSVFYLHPAAEHVTLAAVDDWRRESEYTVGLRRPKRVDRVVFRTDERFFQPELDIVPDRAYWVSDIDPAGPGHAYVDAISWGCGREEPVSLVSEAAGVQPLPWTSQRVDTVRTVRQPARDHIEVFVGNVNSLRIDTSRSRGACLGVGRVTYRVTTDVPTTIALSDGRRVLLPRAGTFEGTIPPA
jgi:pimeloyl-ACP methyl ester carboxylesterase